MFAYRLFFVRKYMLPALPALCAALTYAQADTVFLLQEYQDNVYHAVYVDDREDSKYYEWIIDFSFDSDDSLSYLSSLESLKNLKKRSIPKTLPRQWCELRMYKGRYYLYAPSDWGMNSRAIVTDSTWIEFNMDGPYASRIDSLGSPDRSTWDFRLTTFDNFRSKLRIHMIDPENQVAVFETITESYSGPHYYRLMVAASHAKKFPIIVNYCKGMKQLEYPFEMVDFERLLGRK